MENKIYLIGIILLIALPIIMGELIYPQNQPLDFKVGCSISGAKCSSSATCNINLRYPNETYLRNDTLMTNLNNGEFLVNLSGSELHKTGTYRGTIYCVEGSNNGSASIEFKVSSSGLDEKSILFNSIFIVLVSLGIFLIILGISTSIPWFGFIGSILFLLGGIYTMIYGFNDITNLYTRGIAITLIGLSFIFMFSSAYEWLYGD
ncbi:MAG: hypothetical protein ACOC5T_02200 [Elusimicrobiota bacterium]